MAQIPAIWVAASLADENAVIVGDWKQLPPIVISDKSIAHKWLGRDIFEVAGINSESPQNLVKLTWQYRMHSQISSIPNRMFYDGELVGKSEDSLSAAMSDWYNADWEFDTPVLLVDTEPLNAWVTSIPRGKGSSRLNLLSALPCVDICRNILKPDRHQRDEGERDRIIIVCPYQPHAKLLDTLLHEYELEEDVRAGTIHTFQGYEAEVVIFDLVNDEPHWRVGLFMPSNDDTTKRLFNVGVTRARSRLIVVGDFTYHKKTAKNAFLGKRFVPYLEEHYPSYSALEVALADLLTRADSANRLFASGTFDSYAPLVIVTQDDFYPLLLDDFSGSKSRIVIYSPFMTENRIGELHTAIRAATERGINIVVVTKAIEERGKRIQSAYLRLERMLREWGVTIVHKRGMHEKIVVIDESVIWSGSLNPLSFTNTQEVMERRASPNLVAEYSRIIRLNELVGEFSRGAPECPICGSDMMASEGRNEPFYWRCSTDGCYTRNIDQPPITDGVLVCSNCGGDVEYGSWGEKPAWRCITNRRHRQRIVRTHLRLPKMSVKIPPSELPELQRYLGLTANPDRREDDTHSFS